MSDCSLLCEVVFFFGGQCAIISFICVYSEKTEVWCCSGELGWHLGQSVQAKEKPSPCS